MKSVEVKMSKNISLLLATLAPALFGCLFYIFVHIPVMGDLWYVVAPFALLLYWGWVGGFYRESGVPFVPAVLLSHLYGIIFFVLYMIMYYGTDIVQGETFADQIIFWFTYPLQFLTVSVGVMIHDTDVDAILVFYTQIYGIIFMIAAFMIGYAKKNGAIKKEKRKEEKLKAEACKIHEATHSTNPPQSPVFQDSHKEKNQ